MHILVFNSGSATLKFQLFETAGLQSLARGSIEASGDYAQAALAIGAFCRRARKYLGAYLALLGGADAILFGGGIGERAPQIRARILSGMEWCGIALDDAANEAALGVERRIHLAAGGAVAA